jgi:HSP20 family protein
MKTSETVKNECCIVPDTDIYENEHEYTLKVEMPGVSKENLDIVLTNDELEITGRVSNANPDEGVLKYSEYSLYDYYRKFRIGKDVNREKIDAALDNGVLTLKLHKAEEVKPKKIEISVH